MPSKSQFRILYRHFLFRLMDVELLSPSARGDASQLFGQFAALLITGSILLAAGALLYGTIPVPPDAMAAAAWSRERGLLSLTMLAVGIFAVLHWDSTFLDRHDVLVLAPLPVPGRTLLAAKVAATAAAIALITVLLAALPAVLWPLSLAPPGTGFLGTLRFMAAFCFALLASAAFLYCTILGIQGLVAQLPRRWYLRASSFLQLAAFTLLLGVYFLEPAFADARALGAPENQRALAWLPSYWFTGLLSELSGVFPLESHAVMEPLARRAWVGLGIAMLVGGGVLLLSYFRTLRKIVEEPDLAPGSRGGMWLPRFGDSPQTALAQFIIRTLLRSRQHRLILAFYLGLGFTLVVLLLEAVTGLQRLTGKDLLHQVNPFVLASTFVMMSVWVLGTRVVFSLPIDLRANWIFRVTPSMECTLRLPAVMRAMHALSVEPSLAISGILLLGVWPWTAVAEHLLILGLLGIILVNISLTGFQKVPFTCSYLPGKSKIHMTFWFFLAVPLAGIYWYAVQEQRAMAHPLEYWAQISGLAGFAAATRWLATASAKRAGQTVQYEESAADELILLRLHGSE